MDFSGLKEKAANLLVFLKEMPAKVKAAGLGLKNSLAAAPEKNARPAGKKNGPGKRRAGQFIERLFERFGIPREKRPLFLYGMGGLVLLIIALAIAIPAAIAGKAEGNGPAADAGPRIPEEDLFFPEEPDFLPEFIPEREPRSSWAGEDIRPYWKPPGNPERWREEIKTGVDKLMEGVP